MNDQTKNRIAELLFLAIENEISQEQIFTLNSLIKNKPELIRYAINYLQINSALKFSRTVAGMKNADIQKIRDDELLTDAFVQMAEYEKIAPEIEICKQEPERELIQRVIYPSRGRNKISKFNLLFIVMNAAAILFIILFLNFTSSRQGIEVATLTDSMNAKWAGPAVSFEKGVRLATGNEKLLLQEGYAELLFDNQAKVTVEGPAEIQILAEDRIGLNYGKLYSRVPKEAVGFSVYTQNSKIVDLGTEFGVTVNPKRGTELHVFKGKTLLFTRREGQDNKGIDVSVGQARHVDNEGHVSVIPDEQEKFVRGLESESVVIMDFDGLRGNAPPANWKLIDNNGSAAGPAYTNRSDAGPSGPADTCAMIGLADGGLQNGPNGTPSGWIQCLKPYDAKAGFYGSFDFYMGNTSDGPDAQFLFGDMSDNNRNYYLVAVSGTKQRYLQELFTVSGQQRTLLAKPKINSDLTSKVWYRFCFRFIPDQGTTGTFTYKVTNIKGDETYLTLDSEKVTLPETLMFGFGSHNDMVCFDNIKIFAF